MDEGEEAMTVFTLRHSISSRLQAVAKRKRRPLTPALSLRRMG